MKKIIYFLPICFICVFVKAQNDATVIYNNTVNSTVTIETNIGLGSGFFIDENIIVTNYHVIKGAITAYCFVNNDTLKYEIDGYVAVDTTVDLILLKVKSLNKPPLKFATSAVTPGQKVYVIGSPKGLSATISDGIVSGLRNLGSYKLIQITAPISPGSSGGPVLNANGELIGVSVSQLKEAQNLNFAIPKTNVELLLNFKNEYTTSIKNLYFSNPQRQSNNNNNDFTTQDYFASQKYFNTGKNQLNLNNYNEALLLFNKAVELDSINSDIYAYRGMTKYHLKNFKGAILDYDKALKLKPSYGEVYDLRGVAKAELSDKEGACEDWNKAFEKGFKKSKELIKKYCK